MISNNLSAQKSLEISLIHQSQNVSDFSTEENIREVFRKSENEIYYRYIFDSRSYYADRLKTGNLSKDSVKILIDKYLIDTPVLRTSSKNCIYILVKKNEQGQYRMYVDLNFDKDFVNDSELLIIPGQTYSFDTKLEFYDKNVIRNIPVLFKIKPNFSSSPLTDNFFFVGLVLYHSNSSIGNFLINSKKFQIECRFSRISNKFGLKNVTINLSEPGKNLQKIDFVKTLGYNIKTDTIISGDYKFIIDSINLNGTKLFFRYFFQEKKTKTSGYKVGNYLEEFSIPDVFDTTKIERVSSYYKKADYALLDFWGSWCLPCIKNFDTLKIILKKYPSDYFTLIGFDSEYSNETQKPRELLKDHKIEYKNFFVNMSNPLSVNNRLMIRAYPTYILVNRDGKIIFRESVEGLEKIVQFLNNIYHTK
jgi:thiol-disulfide isomerase/thioredoxin